MNKPPKLFAVTQCSLLRGYNCPRKNLQTRKNVIPSTAHLKERERENTTLHMN
jgi:hypothetical protein